jgi:rare lipoprotein A
MPGSSPVAPVIQSKPQDANCMAYREQGVASWYGMDFHGKKTASGEIFDMHGISAAHRTLPLGSVVRVTNLDNFKSIKTRVNDRGPLYRNRVTELSYGAAKELGFAETGTTLVKIEVIEPLPDTDAVYTVHAGSFLEEEGALSLKDRLGKKFETVFIDTFETNMARFYRVRVGNYSSEEKAERVAAKLTLEGVEPVVLRKDY